MILALIDNGSLEPSAHRQLRTLSVALARRVGVEIHAVSWKHSDRIPAAALDGAAAATLETWLRAQVAGGERDFLFIPFFVSPQGAIGSFLRRDLERMRATLGDFRFQFTPGLAESGELPRIAADGTRTLISKRRLAQPSVIVVDHGGPSVASAVLRDQIAAEVARLLGPTVGAVAAASLEGQEFSHNQPLFADLLGSPRFDHGDVVVAPLFLAPGRHAGPHGDLAEIAAAAEDRGVAHAQRAPLHCHFTSLIGAHPAVVDVLGRAALQTLSTLSVAA